MKIGDSLMGLILLGLAIAIFAYARTLPNPVQQVYGPGAIPSLVAVALGIASVLLIWRGRNAPGGFLGIELAPWARDVRYVARFLLVPGAVVFYMLFVVRLGFLLTTGLILLAMFLSLRVSPIIAVANALLIPLLVHTAFYLGLGVQLPWGVLGPIRW
jgi:putative tricarboxylic transport membrane protein